MAASETANHHAGNADRARLREERGVTLAGMVVNVGLTLGKVAVGIIARSSAIIADGLHSGSDLASDLAVLWSIRAARRPADEDHHYGHSRYEAIVSLFVGILLVIAAVIVAAEAIVTIGRQHGTIRNWWPLWMALASILLKETLYWWTRAVGRRYRNSAIAANAWHHRSDAFSSVAAAAGIAGALIGGPRWAFLDHLTAVVLAAFLVIIGIRISRDSLVRLSDRAPAPPAVQKMQETICAISGVRSFHAFRARHAGAGSLIEMDVHIEVDPAISVSQGHDIATQVETELRRTIPDVSSVVVHIDPGAEETADS